MRVTSRSQGEAAHLEMSRLASEAHIASIAILYIWSEILFACVSVQFQSSLEECVTFLGQGPTETQDIRSFAVDVVRASALRHCGLPIQSASVSAQTVYRCTNHVTNNHTPSTFQGCERTPADPGQHRPLIGTRAERCVCHVRAPCQCSLPLRVQHRYSRGITLWCQTCMSIRKLMHSTQLAQTNNIDLFGPTDCQSCRGEQETATRTAIASTHSTRAHVTQRMWGARP